MRASRIAAVDVSAYTIPTDFPESDGTLEWNSTTIIVVEIRSADKVGVGFTYGPVATAQVIESVLAPLHPCCAVPSACHVAANSFPTSPPRATDWYSRDRTP